jgi:hypothetical protein
MTRLEAGSKLNHSDELPNFQCQELLREYLTYAILLFYVSRPVQRCLSHTDIFPSLRSILKANILRHSIHR